MQLTVGSPNPPLVKLGLDITNISTRDIEIVKYKKTAEKRFTARVDNEGTIVYFTLDHHGFGPMGKGINYYVPVSIGILLNFMANEYKGEPDYISVLTDAAHRCGETVVEKKLELLTSWPLANEITKTLVAVHRLPYITNREIDMFKKFAALKNPVVPSEEVRRSVEGIILECIKYWNSTSDLMAVCVGAEDAQAPKKAYDQAKEICYLIQTTVAKILDIWPQGLNLVKAWQKMASLNLDMVENDFNCGKYLHTAYSTDPKSDIHARDFVIRRHQLANMIDLSQSKIQKMLVSSKIHKLNI